MLGLGLLLALVGGCREKEEEKITKEGEALEDSSERVFSWPSFRGGGSLLGVLETRLELPLEKVWELNLGEKGEVLGSMVAHGKRGFIGSNDGTFVAFDWETGEEHWRKTLEMGVEGSAGLVGDLVIFGDGDGIVRAWKQEDGGEVWSFETEGEILGSPNIWKGALEEEEKEVEVVLIGSYDNRLYALRADTGEKLWHYETNNYINGAPAIYEDMAFFGGCDGFIYVVDVRTGKEVKQIDNGAYVANSVLVDQGVAYTSHYGNRVEAYSVEDGVKIWSFGEREFPYYSTPVVTEDFVYAAGRGKRLHKIDRVSGEGEWSFRARDKVDSSPLLTANDLLFFGDDEGFLYAVDAENGEEVWSYEVGEPLRSSPVIVGEYLVIGCSDGKVYGFRSTLSTEGLALP